MEISFLITQQIISMFLMIAVGFILTRINFLAQEAQTVLSRIALNVLLPCVIVKAFQIDYRKEIRNGLIFAFALAILFHIILILLPMLLKKWFKLSAIEQASLSYPNSGEILIPLVVSVLSKEMQIYCCAFLLVQLFFILTHGDALVSGQPRIRLKRIFRNVNVIAIAVALILFAFQIPLPGVITGVVDSFAGMMAPACMLAIGISIGKCPIKKIFSDKRTYLTCFFRLLGMPLLILLFLKVSGITHLMEGGKDIALIVFMATASSTSATITNFAYYYKKEEQRAGMIHVMSVLLLAFTLPLMVMLYIRIL